MADREQTLRELVEQLPANHRARLEYENIRRHVDAWRTHAEKNIVAPTTGRCMARKCADDLAGALASATAVPKYVLIGYAEHGAHQTPGPGDAIIDSDEASDYVSECVTPLYIAAAPSDGGSDE